jgi:hypothetical protein
MENFDAEEQPVKLPNILFGLRHFKDRGRGTRVADPDCEDCFSSQVSFAVLVGL